MNRRQLFGIVAGAVTAPFAPVSARPRLDSDDLLLQIRFVEELRADPLIQRALDKLNISWDRLHMWCQSDSMIMDRRFSDVATDAIHEGCRVA